MQQGLLKLLVIRLIFRNGVALRFHVAPKAIPLLNDRRAQVARPGIVQGVERCETRRFHGNLALFTVAHHQESYRPAGLGGVLDQLLELEVGHIRGIAICRCAPRSPL